MKRTKNFFIALLGFCLMGSGVMAQDAFVEDEYLEVDILGEGGLSYSICKSEVNGYYAVVEINTKKTYSSYEMQDYVKYEDIQVPVTAILGTTFTNASHKLESVTLSSNMSVIPDGAFSGCELLKSINLENITEIGTSAFQSCLALGPKLNLSNVKNIGNYAFQGCGGLTTLTIGVADIGQSAFSGANVSTLTFADGLTEIPTVASQFASTLTTVTIPTSATAIAPWAFYGCSNISRVVLNNVTSIGAYAFSGCTMLSNIYLANVTSIGDYAFQNCTSLRTADLLSAASLGAGVFQGAKSLNAVSWPSNYVNMPDYTFGGCEKLETVCDANNSSISVFTYLTDIGDEAFKGCYALKGQVEFSQSLTKIGTKAFQGVANVTEFKFNSNPKIEDEVFGAAITRNLYLTDDNVTAAFSGNSNTFTNVYYTRVIPTSESGKRKYAGLVLPFVPVTNDDYVYHKLAEVNGNELIFETSNTASANVPYLFENRSDNTTVTITGQNVTFGQSSTTDVVENVGDWKAIGVYENKTVPSNKKCYAISGGDFTQYVYDLTVKPYRAYWRNDGASLANFMLRTSRGDVTAIKMAELDEVTLPTVYYDLTGRMVNNPVKGNIYIVNGKKVVF